MSTTTEIRTTKKRSVVAPSNVMVTKTPVSSIRMSMGSSYGPGNVIERSSRRVTYAGPPSLKPGVVGQVTKEGVNNVIQTRDREKAEMDDLNNKLCNHIEQTHFLRANCEALTAEIERLKKTKGYDQERVADLYKTEIEELRTNNKTLEDSINPLRSSLVAKEDEIEVLTEKLKDAEDEVNRLTEKLRQFGDENGDLEGQCKQLKNEIDLLTNRINYLEGQNEMQQGDNRRIMKDCEEAITKQIDAEERAKDAEEELEFVKQALEEEIHGLREQLKQKQNPVNVQEMWKKNFGNAVSTMKQHFRDELNRVSDEVRRQSDERLRVLQMGINKDNHDGAILKSDNMTLKTQIGDKKKTINDLEAHNASLRQQLKALQDEFDAARDECEKEKCCLRDQVENLNCQIDDVMGDLRELQDKKLGLDIEIATYRRLLEGEESRNVKKFVEDQQQMQSRGGADLAQIISGGGGGSSMQSTMNESHGRINMKKMSNCLCSFGEMSHEGAFVSLENSSATKEAEVGNWKIERTTRKGCIATHAFPPNFRLKKGQSIKIFASEFDNHKEKGADDIVSKTAKNWGFGDGHFTLKNEKDAQKADLEIRFT